MDEIDRILTSEAELEPSPELARRVMQAVQLEACSPAPLPFPWRRVGAGSALLALAGTAVAAAPALCEPAGSAITAVGEIGIRVACVALGTATILVATLWFARGDD